MVDKTIITDVAHDHFRLFSKLEALPIKPMGGEVSVHVCTVTCVSERKKH